MSISLEAFIASKPKELRLGQYFVNCYCKPVEGRWDECVDKLYQLEGKKAEEMIKFLMMWWQWYSLPDITSSL